MTALAREAPTSTPASPFDRCGLAALSDLAQPAWREAYRELELAQGRSLSREPQFRGKAYKWPSDALRWWSRVWEYPYVFHQLKRLRAEFGEGPRVLDVGSGVTFFPFELARLGYRVHCTDLDPVCGPDLDRAARLLLADPSGVRFRPTDGRRLPFEDGEFDAVYCVSVLEHVADPAAMVAEISRVLRPAGRLLLTMDLALEGDADLTPERFSGVMGALGRFFRLELPETTVHPLDLLTSDRGPCPMRQPGPLEIARAFVKQKVIKRALGRPAGRFGRVRLAVHGAALVRRD